MTNDAVDPDTVAEEQERFGHLPGRRTLLGSALVGLAGSTVPVSANRARNTRYRAAKDGYWTDSPTGSLGADHWFERRREPHYRAVTEAFGGDSATGRDLIFTTGGCHSPCIDHDSFDLLAEHLI